MDIDHEGEVVSRGGDTPNHQVDGRQIILPKDVLPSTICVLPQENRPFFPGQAVPLLMSATQWLPTLQAVRERKQEVIGVVATRRPLDDSLGPEDLYDVGTICRVHRVQQADDQLQVLLEGLQRFRIRQFVSEQPPLTVSVQHLPEPREATDDSEKAYAVAIINMIKELIPLNPLYGEELKMFLARSNPNEPSVLADFAASLTSATKEQLQDVLETLPLLRRLEKVAQLLSAELKIAQAQMDIRQHVEEQVQGQQREAFLRQQLKFIQKELGLEKDDKTAELEEFKARIADLAVPEGAAQRIEEELKKLAVLEVGSPEYGVTRNYLDWLTSVPWGVYSDDAQDLAGARKVLDRHHEGLDDIKKRIVEFLALGIMKGDAAGSIICFVGPPGVGKTSLGRAIAEALGREFYRFSVGGMRDEAEIKGHRRTYIGAMPGKLIQALKDTGTANPVIMLDEVDKIGASYQGDPASALLEVLDPEQNSNFHDHYLDCDVDLSKVLFVCTANQLDTIPGPLLDRMEVIQLSGYLSEEKLAIARNHLWPRQLSRAGLPKRGKVSITNGALKRVIDNYSREAGVRRLDKSLATVVRKAVVELLEAPGDDADKRVRVTIDDIESYLGAPLYHKEVIEHGVGVVTGLAWTALGGATLSIEASRVHERAAGLKLTGQLGDVMQESANIAYSYVAGHAEELGAHADYFDRAHIHLHVPAGATPKDGPSAGITMATALVSLARDKAPKRGFSMTGELTLTGSVLPIGGVREKLIAAKRQGLKQVILPEGNRRDFEEVPAHVKQGLTIHFVRHFDDILNLVF